MRWIIWSVKVHTGDLHEPMYEYTNRGHAVAKLRGLVRRAWLAGSEMQYTIRRG